MTITPPQGEEIWHRWMHRARRIFKAFESERREGESVWHFTIATEADELDGGFIARVVEMPGAMGQGDTEREAADSAVEALSEIFTERMHSCLLYTSPSPRDS